MFKFNWILSKKLAIGSYPRNKCDFKKLSEESIVSIFCLCTLDEISIDQNEIKSFI